MIICTPDKDLAQCVRGTRVVQLDRRRGILRDEASVEAKFGVKPQSIPDYLAMLGDSADGFPGIPGWGEKPQPQPYLAIGSLRTFPETGGSGIRQLAMRGGWQSRFNSWDDALLFRKLATLRLDAPVFESVGDLRWRGPRPSIEEQCRVMGSHDLFGRATSAITNALVQTA